MPAAYILQIRDLVRKTKNGNVVIDDKFFDSTRFWQSAFEKSQAEQTKLMDKVFELEQRNQALLAKTHDSPIGDIKSPKPTKRKAAGIEEYGTGKEAAKKRSRGRIPDLHSPTDSRATHDESNEDPVNHERT